MKTFKLTAEIYDTDGEVNYLLKRVYAIDKDYIDINEEINNSCIYENIDSVYYKNIEIIEI